MKTSEMKKQDPRAYDDAVADRAFAMLDASRKNHQLVNGNRQIRKLAKPEVITHGPLKGTAVLWEGAIDGEWFARFITDRNGTAEANAKSWLDWKP